MTRILMIEDDARLAAMVRSYLGDAGFEVVVADDAARGLRHLERQACDLVLLDLMLPDADGLDVCRRIRAGSAVPIIMVTAKGETTDRVVGLELGADDYLAKPFDPRELLARVRAVLRRRGDDAGKGNEVMRFGRLEIDRASRQVRLDGHDLGLTARQHDLLVAMAERAGRVLSRDQLIDLVGANGGESIDRSIDVHIARIRAGIEDDPHRPRRIITVR
ncbi:MAG TPA: response regulator transcription factor, partial [Burkholderiaceae bacterium]|nr:response regulator transcription factor [Burkholderiaceae bacterium]